MSEAPAPRPVALITGASAGPLWAFALPLKHRTSARHAGSSPLNFTRAERHVMPACGESCRYRRHFGWSLPDPVADSPDRKIDALQESASMDSNLARREGRGAVLPEGGPWRHN